MMDSTDIAQNYLTQSKIFIKARNFKAATDLTKKAIHLDADNPHAYYLLAIILNNTNEFEAARCEIEYALKLSPHLDDILSTAALIASNQKRFVDAKQYIDEALAINPEDSDHYHTLAILYKNIKKELVLPTLNAGLQQNPKDVNILTEMADYYFEQESPDSLKKAATYAKLALKINPEHEGANIRQGYLSLCDNKIEESKFHALVAIRCNENSTEAQRLFCHIKSKSNYFWKLWWIFIVFNKKNPRWDKIPCYIFGGLLGSFFIALLSKSSVLVGNLGAILIIFWPAWIIFCFLLAAYLWSCRLLLSFILKKELRQVKLKTNF